MHLQANTTLQSGKYKIVRYISRGGFGCTYEAENVLLRARIAIKELFVSDFCQRDMTTGHISLLTDAKQPLFNKLRRKFIDEARVIASLHHPGIVRVTDVFEENGTAYYVMDYIDGQSLRDLVKYRGALSEAQAVGYIRQVAEALQYVHEKKLLHLDLKPANIMVNDNDQAIIIDFGVSKQYDEESGENTSTLIGYTRGYAPIEQIEGDVQSFTPTTDIYSLGATLYNLLCGDVPPVANKLIKGLPIAPLQAHAVSNTTIQAIRAAMQADKNDRPQSVAEFLALIDGKEDFGKTHIYNDKTHYNDFGKTNYKEKGKSNKNHSSNGHGTQIVKDEIVYISDQHSYKQVWIWIALCVVLGITIIACLRGCENKNLSTSIKEELTDTLSTIVDSVDDECNITMKSETTQEKANKEINGKSNSKIHEKQLKPTNEIHNSEYIGEDTENDKDIVGISEIIAQPEEEEKPFEVVDRMPQFPGGNAALLKYISSNLNYPTVAAENGIQGRVLLRFVVSKTGNIENIQVLRSPDPSLEQEAIRVVKSMPKWVPGEKNGENVSVYFTLPITFRLS